MILARRTLFLIISVLTSCLLFTLYESMIIVPEGHITLLLPINMVDKKAQEHNVILKPGLHFKLPFLTLGTQLDNRLQTLSLKRLDFTTMGEKPIFIYYYVKWQIENSILYYKKTNNDSQRVKLMITQTIDKFFPDEKPIPQYRLNQVIQEINARLQFAGIHIVDIGFNQLKLSPETDTLLLKNMELTQASLAIAQDAEGKAQAKDIRTAADIKAKLILAKTRKRSAQIKGQGDAIAASIYNRAYLKNPEFALFYLNLETYQKGFSGSGSTTNNLLILNPKNELSSSIKKSLWSDTKILKKNREL